MVDDADPGAAQRPFAETLRHTRLRAGLTQELLAERAGLSARGLSDLERGARSYPRPDTLRMLADGLGLVGEERRAFLRKGKRPSVPRIQAGTTPAPAPAASPRVALPIPSDSFIGRDEEIDRLVSLMRHPSTRLVTLTGPGGVGKTRLALVVAEQLHGDFPDGIWFVDLAPVSDVSLFASTIATALGLQDAGEGPVYERLASRLRDERTLLLLDNGEHMLAAGSEVIRLIAACLRLAILTTSREPWRLRGEQEIVVSPLPVPNAEQPMSLADLAALPSVALFLQRAQALVPGLIPDETNAAAISGICQRLEGLPLAIELAAARCKLLPPAALLARLEQRLPVLTGGARDLPERQRTMRNTIAWSFDLLREEDRRLLRRLAVFAGGWTFTSAEAVVSDEELPDILGGLGSLFDKSLIQHQQTGNAGDGPRFTMLETIREFARERLEASGELNSLRAAHAAYFASLGPHIIRDYIFAPTALWERLAPEIDNLRLALNWAADRHETETGLWLAHLLAILSRGRGSISEARKWIRHFLSDSTGSLSVARARALNDAGRLALQQNDLDTAATFAPQLAAAADALHDALTLELSRSLAMFLALNQGDVASARRLADEGLAAKEKANAEPHVRLFALEDSASVAYVEGDLDRMAALWKIYLTHLPSDADLALQTSPRVGLAVVARRRGNMPEAVRLWLEALGLLQGHWSDTWNFPLMVELARLAQQLGQPGHAVRLLAATAELRRRTGLGELPEVGAAAGEISEADLLAMAQESLGQEAFAIAWTAGSATPLEMLLDDIKQDLARSA